MSGGGGGNVNKGLGSRGGDGGGGVLVPLGAVQGIVGEHLVWSTDSSAVFFQLKSGQVSCFNTPVLVTLAES